jgi:hypothetical protein
MAKTEPHLFDRYTPPEMVDKLKRELDRFKEADTRRAREDHMMNFVWTAWHLYEWTWRGIEALGTNDPKRLEKALGATWQSDVEFRDWAKRECPELGACRQLSNAAKHPGSSDVAKDELTADVTARPTMSAAKVTLADIALVEHWSHEIKYGEGWQSAESVFQRILDFWTHTMGYGLNIDWQRIGGQATHRGTVLITG